MIIKDDLPENEVLEEDSPEEEMVDAPVAPTRAPVAASSKSAMSANPPRAAAPRKPSAAVVDPAVADAARRREQKRNRRFDVEQAIEDEPDSLAAILLKRMGLPPHPDENEARNQDET
jgi:hypothetical protein